MVSVHIFPGRNFPPRTPLATLNRPQEFELHLRGALRNGCSMDELRETFMQIAAYVGAPAGVEAFRIARRVFAEEDAP